MNEVMRTIVERRSVRAFTDQPIKKADVDSILECARYAPSANNTQNWHFTAIHSQAMIERVNGWIVEELKASGNPNYERMLERSNGRIFRNASCVIIVSTEKSDRFGVINASAATQNILLAAASLGIGSCWIGTVGALAMSKQAGKYASELRLPPGYSPYFGVTLGYAASQDLEAPPRRQGVVVSFESE
ncbi:MAG TPA: nitroreductase family protein [Spirochaetia bacterium]|nr:nitroreductase family protein [Spirochaetia bacterium]